MFEIKGKINTAICYANVVEEEAIEQIRRMCDHEFTKGSRNIGIQVALEAISWNKMQNLQIIFWQLGLIFPCFMIY